MEQIFTITLLFYVEVVICAIIALGILISFSQSFRNKDNLSFTYNMAQLLVSPVISIIIFLAYPYILYKVFVSLRDGFRVKEFEEKEKNVLRFRPKKND